MSTDDSVSREVAWRLFAREYDDSTMAFKEGEDDRAPNYVVTPTGAKINRLFVVGVLTEVERVGDGDLLRARVSDPTGVFVVYAGQYQPDAVSFLADAETPSFVAVVGKARTYEPDDSDEVYTSVRPEEMNEVDPETRDRWNVETARATLRRVEAVRGFLGDGEQPDTRPPLHDLAETVDYYDTDTSYLDELEREARDVLTETAGEGARNAAESDDSVDTTPDTSEADEPADTVSAEPDTDDDVDAPTPTSDAATTEADEATAESDDSETATGGGLGDFEDVEQEDVGDWEWDEGQREEVKEEFGAEFETATEVEEPDEEPTPEGASADAVSEDTSADEPSDETPTEEPAADEAATEPVDEPEATEPADANPQDVVMGIIEDEGGDEGIERSEIIQLAADRGVDNEEAEGTLEDLLLEGMCYPTDGDRIKPL